MFNKLSALKARYSFLSEKLADPAVIGDMSVWQKYSKEQSDLTETVEKYEAQGWIEFHTDFDGNRAIITFKRK